MANHLYGYNPSSYGGGGGASNFSSLYSPRSGADAYNPSDSSLYGASRYLGTNPERGSSMFSQSDILRYGGAGIGGSYPTGLSGRVAGGGGASQLTSQSPWSGIDVGAHDHLGAGIKRPSESLYHQTLLGTNNMIGQSEAWFSSNPLAKRPRFESGSNLPIYPQRPGEKDCAHYMLTRTCKFAESCKFDHPIWVPEGGIPDWKEVPLVPPTEILPERPGEPDCPYFLKTQKCKFGVRCKFNHPKDKMVSVDVQESVVLPALPERPSEPPCAFYLKTGKCKFGVSCKFHHPKDIQLPPVGHDNATDGHSESAPGTDATTGSVQQVKPTFAPASLHNSKGLPIRPGEVDCPFYLKTGSCKYGATCRYNHPDRYGINQPANVVVPSLIPSPGAHLPFGIVNPAASILQTIDPRLAQTTLGLAPAIYPQRPGQIECDYYMKSGKCLFAERCKYHHPIDRSSSTLATKEGQQENVKLTLAGLPRREGATNCPYYMKTGTCKYGATCKFDHPPPAEVLAMATSAAVAATDAGGEGDGKVDATGDEQQQ